MDYYHPYLGDEFLKKHFAASAQHAVLVYASEELNKVHVFELQSPEQIDEILAKVISLKSATKFLAVNETISVYGYGEVQDNNADANFEEEAFRLPKDLRKSIQEIEEAGYLRKLIEYLEEIEKKKKKISRLKITSDYRIYLMDYSLRDPVQRAARLPDRAHEHLQTDNPAGEHGKATVSLYKFNSYWSRVVSDLPTDEIRPLTNNDYTPVGLTALYDLLVPVGNFSPSSILFK